MAGRVSNKFERLLRVMRGVESTRVFTSPSLFLLKTSFVNMFVTSILAYRINKISSSETTN